jgi:hypothetical protein
MGTQEKKLRVAEIANQLIGVGNRQFPAGKTFSYAITV